MVANNHADDDGSTESEMNKSKPADEIEEVIEAYGPIQAVVTANPDKFYMLFSKCAPYRSLETKRSYRDLYFEVREQKVIVQTTECPGTIQSSHTFTADYFDKIDLRAENPVGIYLPAKHQRDRMDMMLDDSARIELRGPLDWSSANGLIATDGKISSWQVAHSPDDRIDVRDFGPQ